MEIIDLNGLAEYKPASITKKIPIMTDQLIVSTVCIDAGTASPRFINDKTDEIVYVLDGTGTLTIDRESWNIKTGMVVMIPSTIAYQFSTSTERLELLLVRATPIPDRQIGAGAKWP